MSCQAKTVLTILFDPCSHSSTMGLVIMAWQLKLFIRARLLNDSLRACGSQTLHFLTRAAQLNRASDLPELGKRAAVGPASGAIVPS